MHTPSTSGGMVYLGLRVSRYSQGFYEVGVDLLSSKKCRQEGLSQGILYRTHHIAKPRDSTLQALPLYLEQHLQSSIYRLGILLGYFS